MCVTVAARHFELRGGFSEPLADEIEPDDDVIDAAENCPVEAIRVTAVEDGRLIAPEPY
jgi:ferredoxin